MNEAKVFFVLRLSPGLLLLLFIAGVAAPSVLCSNHFVHGVSPLDSPRTLEIAGMTFTYKLQNIGFAILGSLFGAAVALTVASFDSRIQERSSSTY
jgi:hypothetical protein